MKNILSKIALTRFILMFIQMNHSSSTHFNIKQIWYRNLTGIISKFEFFMITCVILMEKKQWKESTLKTTLLKTNFRHSAWAFARVSNVYLRRSTFPIFYLQCQLLRCLVNYFNPWRIVCKRNSNIIQYLHPACRQNDPLVPLPSTNKYGKANVAIAKTSILRITFTV